MYMRSNAPGSRQNPFSTASAHHHILHVAVLLLIVCSCPSSAKPIPSAEQKLRAAERKKNELKSDYDECQATLDRWHIENVYGPQLLKKLKEGREDNEPKSMMRELVEEKELEFARKQVAELTALGYQLNGNQDLSSTEYHIRERQCEELKRQYEEMLAYYHELANTAEAEVKEESKFEDSDELEFELTPAHLAEIADECNQLLIHFNAARTLDAKWAILHSATHCPWFGVGFDYCAFYQEGLQQPGKDNPVMTRPNPVMHTEKQYMRPGALTVIPNPYPNPYATLPHPSKYQPVKPDWQIRWEKDREAYNERRHSRPPPKKEEKKPEKKPSKPTYSGGGEAYGY